MAETDAAPALRRTPLYAMHVRLGRAHGAVRRL